MEQAQRFNVCCTPNPSLVSSPSPATSSQHVPARASESGETPAPSATRETGVFFPSCPYQEGSFTHHIVATRGLRLVPDISSGIQLAEGSEHLSYFTPAFFQSLSSSLTPVFTGLARFVGSTNPSSFSPIPLTLSQQALITNYLCYNPSLARAILQLAPQLSDFSLSAPHLGPLPPQSVEESTGGSGVSNSLTQLHVEPYELAIQLVPLSVSLPTEPSLSSFLSHPKRAHLDSPQ
ncbi:hypothetical protein NE237_019590 [Protea cynaroides]|uniref:Uncharacterized protein n=1 Tax=Protea cynaroides TaxID=273540 RepID=A0A9Q0H7S7_9MAGN|nr:hypothetical protein NE237_019590 [Protea cynaroides]